MRRPTWMSRLTPIVLVPIAAFVALGAWALSSPVGASPDDDFHLASIWCAGGERPGLCAPGDTPTERRVDLSLVSSACYATDPTVSAGCQADLGLFSSTVRTVSTDRGSFQSNYPPVFYLVMNAFASPNIELSVLVMRLVNVVLFLGAAIALWFALPRENRRTLLLLWTLTTVPLGLSLIASTNPSSWAITGVATAWFALYGFLSTSGWSRQRLALAVIFALSAFAASGARADAAVYTVIGSLAAIALTWSTARTYLWSLLLPAALAVVSAGFFLLSGQSAVAAEGLSSGETIAIVAENPRSALGVLAVNLAQLPFLWVGIFGTWGLGWLDTQMPAIVWVGAAGSAIGVLFVALGRSSRSRVWVAGSLAALAALIPLYVLQRSLSFVGEQVQPRYVMPLLILCAAVVLLAFQNGDVKLTRPQSYLVAGVLSVAGSMALFVTIKRYVAGINTASGVNLDAGIAWWWATPVTPMATWAIGSVALAVALFAALRVAARG